MSSDETVFFRCIPRFATHNRNLPQQARFLFVVIAQEANLDTGKVQMTIEYLAQISGLSERTVLRYVPLLEAEGYIRVERGSKGSKIPNTYEIIGAAFLAVISNSRLYRVLQQKSFKEMLNRQAAKDARDARDAKDAKLEDIY